MATAVKNSPETTTTPLFDRPAAISLVGVVYVVGSLGIVFKLLPYIFWQVLHLKPDSAMNNVLVAMLLVAGATGLVVLGLTLLGPRAAHGTRAGIFIGVVGVLGIILLTRWASLWFEYWSFYDRFFNPTVGAILTALVGVALTVVGGYYFLSPQFEAFLQSFEDQGWFSANTFKGQQGQRVRRGTILGILLLAGAGIWTMYNGGSLRRLPPNWELNVPFTAHTDVNLSDYSPDDFRIQKFRETFKINSAADGKSAALVSVDRYAFYYAEFPSAVAGGTPEVVSVDRYAFRDFNTDIVTKYVKIEDVGASDFTLFDIVEKSKFNQVAEELKKSGNTEPKAVALEPLRGADVYATVQLLPSIMYTLPILLLALALWVAWRIVNYPAFADFLIATEAELNKVSWTTRPKLVQDTIVVLITVFLMAGYLFAMDQAWSHLLSWQPIRILQIPKDTNDSSKSVDSKPW